MVSGGNQTGEGCVDQYKAEGHCGQSEEGLVSRSGKAGFLKADIADANLRRQRHPTFCSEPPTLRDARFLLPVDMFHNVFYHVHSNDLRLIARPRAPARAVCSLD